MRAFAITIFSTVHLSTPAAFIRQPVEYETPDNSQRFTFEYWPHEKRPEQEVAKRYVSLLYGKLVMAPSQDAALHLALRDCQKDFLNCPGRIPHVDISDVSSLLTNYLHNDGAHECFMVCGILLSKKEAGKLLVFQVGKKEMLSESPADAHMEFLHTVKKHDNHIIGYSVKVRRYPKEEVASIGKRYKESSAFFAPSEYDTISKGGVLLQ